MSALVVCDRPLSRRLGQTLAKSELMPLIVTLFENVCHLDWDSKKQGQLDSTVSPVDGAQSDSDRPGSPSLPTDAEAEQSANRNRQKLLLALVHTDIQLAFCRSFGALEYLRVIFPYLEDCLYVFPATPPHVAVGDATTAAAPGPNTTSAPRSRSRSLWGGRWGPSHKDAGHELNLQYQAANAMVALASSKALGKTLALRFMVPPVVRQVGRKRPAKMMACMEGNSVDAFERKELFRCVLELSAALGNDALDFVLDTLYQTVERLCQYYPKPQHQSDNIESASMTISRDALAMQEVFNVLSGILQRLHRKTVVTKFFVRPNGLSFPRILAALPPPVDVDLHLGYVEALVHCCQVHFAHCVHVHFRETRSNCGCFLADAIAVCRKCGCCAVCFATCRGIHRTNVRSQSAGRDCCKRQHPPAEQDPACLHHDHPNAVPNACECRWPGCDAASRTIGQALC